jgi:hypothetical protein
MIVSISLRLTVRLSDADASGNSSKKATHDEILAQVCVHSFLPLCLPVKFCLRLRIIEGESFRMLLKVH